MLCDWCPPIVALLDTSARAIAAEPAEGPWSSADQSRGARRDVRVPWWAARLVANKKLLRLRRATGVAVVESANLRQGYDIAEFGWLDRAWRGRALLESEMRA